MGLKITDSNFDMTMETFGQTLKYYSGRLCSCVGENNGVPKISCGCNLGFYYEAPETITGMRTSVSYKYVNSAQGVIFNGGAQFTISKVWNSNIQEAWNKLSHGDVIVVDNKVRRDTDILRKGVRDKLFAFDIQDIVSVSQKDKVYVKDTDYELNGTQINWIGDEPELDSYYTVEFTCKQQYKVWEVGAKDRGTTQDEMPKLVICVLRRFVENEQTNPLDDFNYSQDIYS